VSWAISERISAFAFYGQEEIVSLQSGSQAFGAPDWQAKSRDRFDTASAGFRVHALHERWDIQFDYFLIDGQGDTEMRSGIAQAFPELRTRSHGPNLSVEFHATPALDVIGTARYEHFDSHDWALQGIEPDTLPAILASGADPFDYDATLVGLSFRYRFGGAAPATADVEP